MSYNITTSDPPPSYVPQCSSSRDDGDFNLGDSQRYDPTSWDYLQTLVPTVIPGIVFGCLALLGCIFFCLWLCVQCCKTPKTKKSRQSYEESHQFIAARSSPPSSWDMNSTTDNSSNNKDKGDIGIVGKDGAISALHPSSSNISNSNFPPPTISSTSRAPSTRNMVSFKQQQKPHWSRHRFYLWSMALLAAAVIGVSIWGMVRSIDATDNTISGFWDLSDDIEFQAVRARNDVYNLDGQLLELEGNLTIIQRDVTPLQNLAAQLNVSQDIQNAINDIPALLTAVTNVRATVSSALLIIEKNVLEAFRNLNADYRDTTLAFQNTWRYIPIAVTFGLTLVAAFLAALSTYTMKHPKTSSVMVSLLWFDIAVLMLLGAGMMSGVYQFSGDTCLYAEAYVLRRAERSIQNPNTRARVLLGLNYYFGAVEIPDDDVVLALTGLPVNQILDAVTSDIGTTLTSLATSPEANQLISTAVSQEATDAIQGAANLIQPIANTSQNLTDITLRSNVQPLYFQFKEYLCCELNDTSYDVWVAWLAAGVMGFVLSIMCSIIIVVDTMRSPRSYAMKKNKNDADGQVYRDAEAEHVEVRVGNQRV